MDYYSFWNQNRIKEDLMLGKELASAIEIFTNPDDLMFFINKDSETQKFSVIITRRNPGFGHSMILQTAPFAKSYKKAVSAVNGALKIARQIVIDEMEKDGKGYLRCVASEEPNIFVVKILSPEQIAEIVKTLRPGSAGVRTFEAAVDQHIRFRTFEFTANRYVCY